MAAPDAGLVRSFGPLDIFAATINAVIGAGIFGLPAKIYGLVGDFTFAARLKGEPKPLSTLFYLPPNPNVAYSASLMAQAEATFMTGKSPYPIERTLLY